MESVEAEMTADKLVEKGEELSKHGNFVVRLYSSQEWMAVKLQIPFLRYKRL